MKPGGNKGGGEKEREVEVEMILERCRERGGEKISTGLGHQLL